MRSSWEFSEIFPADTGQKLKVHDIQKTSWTSSERLMYVQFMSCVYGVGINIFSTHLWMTAFKIKIKWVSKMQFSKVLNFLQEITVYYLLLSVRQTLYIPVEKKVVTVMIMTVWVTWFYRAKPFWVKSQLKCVFSMKTKFNIYK